MDDLIITGTDPVCLTAEQIAELWPSLDDVPRLEWPYSRLWEATNGCTMNFDMSSWHNACDTTHCAAGWVVALAGAAGKALESRFGTPAAARLILQESCPAGWPMPNFHASNEAAAAFISHMAERERRSEL